MGSNPELSAQSKKRKNKAKIPPGKPGIFHEGFLLATHPPTHHQNAV